MIFPVKVCDGKEKCSKRQPFYLENKGFFFFFPPRLERNPEKDAFNRYSKNRWTHFNFFLIGKENGNDIFPFNLLST